MTIELGDGLQFPELLEIAKAVNVTKLIDPNVRKELLDAINAVLSAEDIMPWLRALPGIGDKIAGLDKALRLAKGFLEA